MRPKLQLAFRCQAKQRVSLGFVIHGPTGLFLFQKLFFLYLALNSDFDQKKHSLVFTTGGLGEMTRVSSNLTRGLGCAG